MGWPSACRTVWGDHERYMATYLDCYKPYYFTGDGCTKDEDGYYWITGRVHDVLNTSGHRIGTAEVVGSSGAPRRRAGRHHRLPARHQGPGHLLLPRADQGYYRVSGV